MNVMKLYLGNHISKEQILVIIIIVKKKEILTSDNLDLYITDYFSCKQFISLRILDQSLSDI
jgi:hypothetical protein